MESTSDAQRAALETRAILGAVAPRGLIGVAGRDRATYLHGLLTNDIKALEAGQGCYAAWLTPQGRMLTDLYVFELGDAMVVDVPAGLRTETVQRLDQFLFSEDVQVTDLSTLEPVCIHGPAAGAVLAAVLGQHSDLDRWAEHRCARTAFSGSPAIVARVSPLGVPGFCVYTERRPALEEALRAGGAVMATPATVEAARIEAGYPVFGADMTADTIPLEAGIEDRAISFTKGCYVGQEVIVRVLHRGHGRVARRLVGLRIGDGDAAAGMAIVSGDRAVGAVTSAAVSPRHGPIAMGYVHRDFATPGTEVEIDSVPGRLHAVVARLPF